MSVSVEGKTALVTGANRGIGKAIVEAFFEHGVKKVYLAVRDTSSTEALTKQFGDKVETLPVDVTDIASIQALAKKADDVDILVNNAGVMNLYSPLASEAEDALKQEFEINVFGLIRVAQAFAPVLEKTKGTLVQLNSIASIKTFGDMSTYCASKAAAYSITQGLKEKLGEKGVSVLSVHPGPIATDMGKGAGFDDAPGPDTVAAGIIEALESGDFHLFPDPMAKQLGEAYQSYADNIILGDFSV
ncbi:SDR family oxidoreductase [Salinimonas sediminis]|uniref:SDR family NAD(P)-dependent oxidoreductase n=1 Tax=Salinimonas sediminis TaxID=2303538 RepID=A0A346NKE9_9ALTE|nr:SDR family oxidoreductase [Salinimonas sediminis]AXR06006.1 SDR family NAD(P)-dependent oxidoreductase [Salinimonas sediminis]